MTHGISKIKYVPRDVLLSSLAAASYGAAHRAKAGAGSLRFGTADFSQASQRYQAPRSVAASLRSLCPMQPTGLAGRKPGSFPVENYLWFDVGSPKQTCFNLKISGSAESVFSSEMTCRQKSHDRL